MVGFSVSGPWFVSGKFFGKGSRLSVVYGIMDIILYLYSDPPISQGVCTLKHHAHFTSPRYLINVFAFVIAGVVKSLHTAIMCPLYKAQSHAI